MNQTKITKYEYPVTPKNVVNFGIDYDGCNYVIVCGQSINGYFCAIPNWNLSTFLSDPSEVSYNSYKIWSATQHLVHPWPEEVCDVIAKSIWLYTSNQHTEFGGLRDEQ